MKRFWGLLLCLLMALPALAQDDLIPQGVVDTALDAVEAVRETRSENYRFQLLNRTTSSSLSCPLVEGETLPFEVTPYRVEVIYPDGVYVVHVSADARYVQLCDPKFGDEMTSPADPETLENACRLTPNAAVPVYVAPSEAVDGVLTATAGEAVRVFGRSSDNAWYQIAAGQGTGWIKAESVTLSGDCDGISATGFTVPDGSTAACFVSSLGAFANVRSQPTTDAARVARIFENAAYQVTARNTAGDWFYIQPGWVAGSVVNTVGDCVNLTVSDSLVGVGFTEDLPGELDESVGLALAQYACTADFAGYMEPRLQIGNANAQVEVGNLPNALRSFPSVDDSEGENLGTIQPGRIIDRVIAGPVCNQGFVWWLVEFDGQTGWTAESNESSSDYYLEPLSGSVDPVTETDEDSGEQAASDEGQDGSLRSDENTELAQVWQQGDSPITDLVFNADGSRLYSVSSIPGFGDGVQGEVAIWNSDGSEVGRVTVATEILGMGLLPQLQAFAIADASGGVTLFDMETLTETAAYPILFDASFSHQTEVAFVSAGEVNLLATSGCTDASCATSQLNVYSLDAGELLWSAEVNNLDITAVAFSNDESDLQVAVSSEFGVHSFNALDGTPRYVYDGNGLKVYDITFNNDDTRLLAAGCSVCEENGSIALIDAQTGALLGVAEAHGRAARTVAYAADYATLVSSDGRYQAILRDSVSGEGLGIMQILDNTITALASDPVTGLAVVGTDNGRIAFLRFVGQL